MGARGEEALVPRELMGCGAGGASGRAGWSPSLGAVVYRHGACHRSARPRQAANATKALQATHHAQADTTTLNNSSLVFMIGLGIGLGIAAGLRPFLPALLAGALASGNALGVKLSPGTYSFLQDGWWLIAAAAALLLVYLLQLRVGSQRFDAGAPGAALAGIGIGVGALLFAGTLCSHGRTAWPGLIGGAAAALIAQAAVRPIVSGARSRLNDRAAREALTLYVDIAALLIAGLVCLLHPLGYVALLLFAWLAFVRWRRGGDGGRYAGLRILGG